jgi:hypothetical protein
VRLRCVAIAIPPGGLRLADFMVHALGNLGFERRERRVGVRVSIAQRPIPGKTLIEGLELLEDCPDVGAAIPVREDVVIAEANGLARPSVPSRSGRPLIPPLVSPSRRHPAGGIENEIFSPVQSNVSRG